jgi:hypothetical protein
MDAIKTITTVGILKPIIDLPWKANIQVEVIIFSLKDTKDNRTITGKSLKGCLKEYANPSLLENESGAWEKHIVENMLLLDTIESLNS